MFIGLYTSRVVLQALGVEDFGIQSVVGGLTSMFAIISGSLSSAISRFITFELGKGDKNSIGRLFSTSVVIQFIIIAVVTILLESVGIWFLNYKMIIPAERLYAANWVFQFSILNFAFNLWSVPYHAAIVAHERMSAYSYISIFEGIMKLVIAFVIMINPFDRLIYYSLLLMFTSIAVICYYIIYCKRTFEECRYKLVLDKGLLKHMTGFAGWNFIGSSSAILRDQGGNVIINLFCGPAVNAARGVAMQVNNAIFGFVSNFMTAINPQITKSYAAGNYEYMMKLIFQGARLSFYILLFISLPVLVSTHYLLELWLGQVPEHTVNFVRLVLIFTLSESLANPLVTAMLATGRIRNYQLVVGGFQLLNLPVSYVCLLSGCPPECVLIVAIFVSILCEFSRLYMLRGLIQLSAKAFLKEVYFNVIIVSIIAGVIPFVTQPLLEEKFLTFILLCAITALCTLISIFYVGCNRNERIFVFTKASAFINSKILKR